MTDSVEANPSRGPVFDRSSTITIVNDLPTVSLVRKGYAAETGTLANTPSEIIYPGGATTMRVKDNAGLYGSQGWMTYSIGGDGAEVMILFECPFTQMFNKNDVTGTPSSHVTVADFARTGPLLTEVRIH